MTMSPAQLSLPKWCFSNWGASIQEGGGAGGVGCGGEGKRSHRIEVDSSLSPQPYSNLERS